MVTEILIIIVVFLMTLSLIKRVGARNLPPGPWGLPLVGMLPFVGNDPAKIYMEMAEKYGDVFSIRLGGRLFVVLNGYDAVREAFVKNGDVFSGRPFESRTLVHGQNIVGRPADYEWKMRRKLFQVSFRRCGVLKDNGMIERLIHEELGHICLLIENHNGQTISDFKRTIIHKCVLNINTMILIGNRYDYDSEMFLNLSKEHENVSNHFDHHYLLNYFPFLLHFPFIRQTIQKAQDHFNMLTSKYIMDHKQTSSYPRSRDVLDIVISKTVDSDADVDVDGETKFSFTDSTLAAQVANVLRVGASTTTGVLAWMFLYMAHYQEVQKLVQEELDQALDDDTEWIATSQRKQLPYTVACMNEIMRHKTFTPLGLRHATSTNVRFRGFDISEKTTVVANMYSVHNDERYWTNPHTFNPSRWIEDGELVKQNAFVPFSLGPRFCMAKQLAEHELFLIFANLMRRFTFLSPEGANDKEMFESVNEGITIVPASCSLRAMGRECATTK
ncbi:cytochrome P450 2J2-like [Glandiceps talaboti]